MAIKTCSELLNSIGSLIDRDNATDEQIAILEDVTDTLNDYETRTKDNTDWKTKYEILDSTWKKKYTERFFNSEDEVFTNSETTEDNKVYRTFDDLFK